MWHVDVLGRVHAMLLNDFVNMTAHAQCIHRPADAAAFNV